MLEVGVGDSALGLVAVDTRRLPMFRPLEVASRSKKGLAYLASSWSDELEEALPVMTTRGRADLLLPADVLDSAAGDILGGLLVDGEGPGTVGVGHASSESLVMGKLLQ